MTPLQQAQIRAGELRGNGLATIGGMAELSDEVRSEFDTPCAKNTMTWKPGKLP